MNPLIYIIILIEMSRIDKLYISSFQNKFISDYFNNLEFGADSKMTIFYDNNTKSFSIIDKTGLRIVNTDKDIALSNEIINVLLPKVLENNELLEILGPRSNKSKIRVTQKAMNGLKNYGLNITKIQNKIYVIFKNKYYPILDNTVKNIVSSFMT